MTVLKAKEKINSKESLLLCALRDTIHVSVHVVFASCLGDFGDRKTGEYNALVRERFPSETHVYARIGGQRRVGSRLPGSTVKQSTFQCYPHVVRPPSLARRVYFTLSLARFFSSQLETTGNLLHKGTNSQKNL